MALKKYGVLKGTVAGHLRDADDDHYQILVHAGATVHRIASNVKSSAPNAPSIVLFQMATALPADFKQGLRALAAGFKALPSRPGGLAIDYVRGGLVKPGLMQPVPPDAPGADNDLKDKLEAAVVKAMNESGALVYAFGQKWGPEAKKRDKYFKFLPGNGIHDIHMNQGNSGKYRKDNGVYQDGAIIFEYPDDKWRAFFFAFQSQTFDTDAQGNPGAGAGTGDGTTAARKTARSKQPRKPAAARKPATAKKRAKPRKPAKAAKPARTRKPR